MARSVTASNEGIAGQDPAATTDPAAWTRLGIEFLRLREIPPIMIPRMAQVQVPLNGFCTPRTSSTVDPDFPVRIGTDSTDASGSHSVLWAGRDPFLNPARMHEGDFRPE
jgi:hypothetical protein